MSQTNRKKTILAWCMYDWANSALIVFIALLVGTRYSIVSLLLFFAAGIYFLTRMRF